MSLSLAGTPGAGELPNALLALIMNVTTLAVTGRAAAFNATANHTYLIGTMCTHVPVIAAVAACFIEPCTGCDVCVCCTHVQAAAHKLDNFKTERCMPKAGCTLL